MNQYDITRSHRQWGRTHRPLLTIAGLSLLICMLLGAAVPLAGRGDPRRGQGVSKPSREVILVAPLAGILDRIDCHEGDAVVEDQTLGKMDDALQVLEVQSARLRADSETAILQKKLQLADAGITLERVTKSFEGGGTSDWEVRKAQLDVDVAVATLKAAKEQQQLEQVNLNLQIESLERYQLKAPFEGRIVEIEAEAGATLAPSDPILTVADFDPLEVDMFLPVELMEKIRIGQKYRLTAGAPVNGELIGTLKSIDRRIHTGSQTFRCELTILNPGEKLPSGFNVWLAEQAEERQ